MFDFACYFIFGVIIHSDRKLALFIYVGSQNTVDLFEFDWMTCLGLPFKKVYITSDRELALFIYK